MYRNVYRIIPITRSFAYISGFNVGCSVPFARSRISPGGTVRKSPVLSACYAVVLTNMLRRSTIVHYFDTCHEWLLGEMRV